uniref:Uncharacterized protein n=1 Tax=Brassica campestris TaxID=3711 RepID=A0A3P5YRN9_BRACM|nr:unnamed protein product [Brassica rapa]
MVQPQEPHFFQPLLPGFQTYLTIPIVFFSKHIQGKANGNTWTLTSDAMDQTWQVIRRREATHPRLEGVHLRHMTFE